MLRLLFVLFIIIPLVELYFLIQVGQVIGAGWTVFAVVATAVIGAALLRIQGISTLFRAQATIQRGQLPAMEVMEGFVLAVSGVFLLTPGFASDTVGFLLLIPAARRGLIKAVVRQHPLFVYGHQPMRRGMSETTVIEGEVVDEDKHLK